MSSHSASTPRPSGLSPKPTTDADLDLLAAILARSLSPAVGRAAAADLIEAFGGLAEVAAADKVALHRQGLAAGAVADLARARSLAVAMARAEACRRPVLSSWTALTSYLRASLAHAPREQFGLFVVDRLFDRAELRLGDRWPQVVRIHRLAGAGR